MTSTSRTSHLCDIYVTSHQFGIPSHSYHILSHLYQNIISISQYITQISCQTFISHHRLSYHITFKSHYNTTSYQFHNPIMSHDYSDTTSHYFHIMSPVNHIIPYPYHVAPRHVHSTPYDITLGKPHPYHVTSFISRHITYTSCHITSTSLPDSLI